MQHRPEAAGQEWEAVLELPFEGSRVIEPGATVVDIFDELQGSLLVLGQPGAGKTTTVLQLVRDLIQRSERDASQPVPVVLNLSAWSPDSPSLLAWIAKEISRKYQIPGQVSRPWMKVGRLVLILDGLDEVAAAFREACVGAINRFSADYGFAGLVVTCRLDEYDALPVRLRTNGAVCLQPLGPQQIDAFLDESGAQVEGLRSVLKTDETLQELARSPLMLSVMAMAYRDRSAAEIQESAGTAEERQAHLFEAYVDRAFETQPTSQSYSRETTTSWLSWLAKRMSLRNQTVFLIEDLQPGFLKRRTQLAAYLVGISVLFGLVFGSLCILYRICPSNMQPFEGLDGIEWRGWNEAFAWIASCTVWFLAIGSTDGLRWREVKSEPSGGAVYRRVLANVLLFTILWVPIMIVFLSAIPNPLTSGQGSAMEIWTMPIPLVIWLAIYCARRSFSRSIHTAESLRLNWARAGQRALWSAPLGLALGVLAFFNFAEGDWKALVVWPMFAATLGGILGGFTPRIVKGKTVSNQGMLLTLRTSLRAGRLAILLVMVVVLASFIGGERFINPPEQVPIRAAFGFVYFFVMLAFWFGGFDLGKHLILRAVIGFTRQGPYDFPRLLNDASRRNLMQRVGNGYLFAHRLVLDHFAAMNLPTPEREETRVEGGGRMQTSVAIVAMSVLAAVGLMLVLIGLQTGARTTVALGIVALAAGVPWLVIRSAVTSALQAARRDEEDDGE